MPENEETAQSSLPAAVSSEDAEHLRLLSIGHKVVAGIVALFSLLPLIHLAIGLAMVFGGAAAATQEGPDALVLSLVGLFFTLFPLVIIAVGLTLAWFLWRAGNDLLERRSYTRCLVVAAISCAFAPIGTVLGVLTLIVLMRPSVKELFGVETSVGTALR